MSNGYANPFCQSLENHESAIIMHESNGSSMIKQYFFPNDPRADQLVEDFGLHSLWQSMTILCGSNYQTNDCNTFSTLSERHMEGLIKNLAEAQVDTNTRITERTAVGLRNYKQKTENIVNEIRRDFNCPTI
jgi:hypothetical protein